MAHTDTMADKPIKSLELHYTDNDPVFKEKAMMLNKILQENIGRECLRL